MSDSEFGHTGVDPLPDRLKQYLTDLAHRELEMLRADLDVKLSALEAALAHPDRHDSIETLVFDLARAATVEAEAAASRAMLDAQIQAQERSGAADALRDLEVERQRIQALRAEMEDLRRRMDFDASRLRDEQKETEARLAAAEQGLAAAQRDLQAAQREAKEARRVADTRALDMSKAREAAGAAQVEAGARLKTLEDKVRKAEADMAEAARIRRDAGSRADAAEVYARETAARASNAEAWGKDLEKRLKDAEARAAREESRLQDAEARADAAAKARDVLTTELENLRQTVVREREAFTRERDTSATERENSVKQRETLTRQHEALANERDTLTKERETLAKEREALAERYAQQNAHVALLEAKLREYDQRLAGADERNKALELQLFQRDRATQDRDEELSSLLTPMPPAPIGRPTRAATRYNMGGLAKIDVDGHVGVLVDLSTGGAQVLSPVPLEEGRDTRLRLLSNEMPTECRGRIVWTRLEAKAPGQPFQHRAGILFTERDVGAIEAFIIRYATT